MVETRIANTNSPWLAGVQVGDIHAIPVSHGEGKFVVTAEEFAELATMVKSLANTLTLKANQVWTLSIIRMVR